MLENTINEALKHTEYRAVVSLQPYLTMSDDHYYVIIVRITDSKDCVTELHFNHGRSEEKIVSDILKTLGFEF